jgi:hypothetical protein
MNKATYDRIMLEVKERTQTQTGREDKMFFQEQILEIVGVSLKVAIAEELLNRACCKNGR